MEKVTEQTYPIESRWIIKSVLGLVLVVLIIFLPLFVLQINSSKIDFYAIAYIIFIPVSLIRTVLQRSNFHFSFENEFLLIRQGILSKQERHIHYGVIQNVFVKQDLFDRIFGLASLALENAAEGGKNNSELGQTKLFGMTVGNSKKQQVEMVGFSGNKISIPGLTKQNAELLKQVVLKKIKENPIEDSQSGL